MSKSVLIVDDEALLCRTLANALRDAGHRVVTAESAEAAALHLFPSQRFDVVVLDHRLPGEAGCQLLERMRAAGQSTPAILMTAYETASMRSRASELAVAGYLPEALQPRGAAGVHRAVAESARSRAGGKQRARRSRPEALHGSPTHRPTCAGHGGGDFRMAKKAAKKKATKKAAKKTTKKAAKKKK